MANVQDTDLAGTGPGQGAGMVGVQQAGAGATPRTALSKLREIVSITDFGGVGDDSTVNNAAFLSALAYLAGVGGGSLLIPLGTFRITDHIEISSSNIEIYGLGSGSVIHLVNNNRSNGIDISGVQGTPVTNVSLRNFAVKGEATYSAGTPSEINGGGVYFHWADRGMAHDLWISGFSDGGLFAFNCNDTNFTGNHVWNTAQGLGFCCNAIDSRANIAVGNHIWDTGSYNGLHLEGTFGDNLGDGQLCDTVLIGNTINNSWWTGINIENAQRTTCIGNTVRNSGMAEHETDNKGIKCFGAPNSVIVGNIVFEGFGHGIMLGANCGESTVTGNITKGNTEGSLLVTDSYDQGGAAVAASWNIVIAGNNFMEGVPVFEGAVSLKINRTVSNGAEMAALRNASGTNIQTWFENAAGNIVWRDGMNIDNVVGGIERQWWRESIGVVLALTANGYVKPRMATFSDNAAAVAGGLTVGTLYTTSLGEVRAVV